MGRTVNWEYDSLPNVTLYMSGGLAANEVDDDDTKRSHFDQEFNWRIDEDSEEFIIRIKRTPEFASKNGHTNVALRIEGGLSENPDGSVKFDGGVGSGESANGVSTFGLSFKISHEASGSKEVEGEGEPEEEPEEKEVAFFDHSQHKLHLAPENFYKNMPGATCDACKERIDRAKWVYSCPNAACDYGVHAACAQFPRTIRHPSHPKHTVKLIKLGLRARATCDVCKGHIHHGMRYNCARCDFDVHTVCPAEEDRRKAGERDASKHLGMTPEQHLAHQQQQQHLAQQQQQQQQHLEQQQQLHLQAMQFESARRTAAIMADAGRAISDLAGPSYYRIW